MSCCAKRSDLLAYEIKFGDCEFMDAVKALGCWVDDARPQEKNKPTPITLVWVLVGVIPRRYPAGGAHVEFDSLTSEFSVTGHRILERDGLFTTRSGHWDQLPDCCH